MCLMVVQPFQLAYACAISPPTLDDEDIDQLKLPGVKIPSTFLNIDFINSMARVRCF